MKWDVLSLVDYSEHFIFSFQLAKTFGNTTFVSVKYQYSSEFFQIGMPHFSLEGVYQYPSCKVSLNALHDMACMRIRFPQYTAPGAIN